GARPRSRRRRPRRRRALIPGLPWPQQDLLLLLPPLSALLALVHGSLLVGSEAGLVHTLERGLASARASIETKLVWLLLALVLFAVALGWVGFASLEDLHIQGHRFQLLVDWIGHANALGGDIEEVTAAAAIPDPGQRQAAVAARGDALARELEHLEQAPVHPGIAIGAAGVSGFAAAYRGEVGQVRTAAERLRAVANEGTGDTARASAVRDASLAAQQAQLALAQHLQTDAQDTLSHTDLQHHTSLVTLLVLVAVSALAGVLLGQAAAGSITHPVS